MPEILWKKAVFGVESEVGRDSLFWFELEKAQIRTLTGSCQ